MKSLLVVSLLSLLCGSVAIAQSAPAQPVNPPSRGPVRSIKIGKASFHYYEDPEVVVASAKFYVSSAI